MNLIKTFVSGFAGTSAMTLFSYAVSDDKAKNFKEPELLGLLMKDSMDRKNLAVPAGWLTHYSIGITWAAVFELVWCRSNVKPNKKSGIVLGSFSGLMAIMIWKAVFNIHHKPPKIDYNRFYGHLFLAHIVYSLSVNAIRREER